MRLGNTISIKTDGNIINVMASSKIMIIKIMIIKIKLYIINN